MDFKQRHGKLLYVLSADVVGGLLSVLVQFYDPLYRCFTFPDYKLVPTLEEYSHLLGIPISDKVTFSGLEEIPRSHIIAEALHLKKSEIEAHWVKKRGMFGLTFEFLIGKVIAYAQAGSMDAFEAIFVLLIYGLALFPNIDGFVDVNAIRILLIGYHVPTLLGDMYFSLHLRNSKVRGTIVCCVPLLYKWFISHLAQTPAFVENKQCLRWSQRLMSLTNDDIVWYDSSLGSLDIIDGCGELSNVPLIGTQGGINYNPALAHCQLGFSLRDKPNNTQLEGLFYQEGKDPQHLKKHDELQLESKDKDALIELLEDRVVKRQREPAGPYSSSMPEPSSAWKKIVDQLVLEKAQIKTSFESEIRRIRRKYAPTTRSSDTVVRGSLG
ncbi:hypothetical protein KIW84_066133 [Lathyrus oleraceus]|uniref:DUF7745 domain-containing protein n=1 Tax=Pisum sativum TaxID=3888 RepID=A0A9D5AB64_PEA|nr:hypothetical protein KIW84_066133 [Pisum sativum]